MSPLTTPRSWRLRSTSRHLRPAFLQDVYVKEGDNVPANFTVAQVGNQLIQTQVAGTIINVPDTVGAQIAKRAKQSSR